MLWEQSEDVIIVFVTAFAEYALKGYWVGAMLYLLKESLDEQFGPCIDAVIEKLSDGRKYVKVQTPDKFMNVRVKDILYFEGTAVKRVMLHTQSGGPVACMGRLEDYEARLAGLDFLRIQKGYLVNMRHIEDIRNYTAKLTDGEVLAFAYRQNTTKFLQK